MPEISMIAYSIMHQSVYTLPNQYAVLPHLLDTVIRHAMRHALLVRQLEAEMAVRILMHCYKRHIHQFIAYPVIVAKLELAAPEFRVPMDAAQQFV